MSIKDTIRGKGSGFCALLLTLAVLGSGFPASAGDVSPSGVTRHIHWYAYKDSLELGRKEGKKIFVNFYADWCRYCVKMDKETFRDPAVVDYLNRHFISAKVNSDTQRQVAEKYHVRGLPSTWFLAENGEAIGSLPGYIPAKMLLKILGFVESESYKKMTFEQYLKKL